MHPSCPGTISTDDMVFFFFQAEDGIRDLYVTGVQTCALPIFRLVLVERDSETPGELVQVRELAVALVVGEEHEHAPVLHPGRSEERRVGKECRSGWPTDQCKKKEEARVVVRVYCGKADRSRRR